MTETTPPSSSAVRVRVPAKINLALKVGAPRPDGYHPLATVYHAVSLFDEVTADWAPPGVFTVQVSGEGAGQVPVGDGNLAVRAARLLARAFGRGNLLGVALTIVKAIPVAGGLAGGSSNGAAALLACSVLWDLEVSDEDLVALAAQLGSDVPFALLGGTAVGSGRGEQIAPALTTGSYHWVLAFGWRGLSTPEVYQRFDELTAAPPVPVVPAELMNGLRAGDPVRVGQALTNDLQAAALALQPRLRRTLEAGRELGAVGAVVSGSGPTCAFLTASAGAAVDLSVALSSEGVCRAVRPATGPVSGARVVS